MSEKQLNEAIQLIRSGQKAQARNILEPYIRANPHAIQAWLWEAESQEMIEGKVRILEMCLRYNPENPQILKGLEILKSQTASATAPAAYKPDPAPVPAATAPIPDASQEVRENRKPCPYCAEMILEDTQVCPFCGRNQQTGMLGNVPASGPVRPAAPPRPRSAWGGLATLLVLLIAGVIFYNLFGFVAIQPIGAIPDGVTLLVNRSGTQLQFFDSPDAMCLRSQGYVSLLCRVGALAALGNKKEIIVLRLPYIESFYLFSTGGATYEK